MTKWSFRFHVGAQNWCCHGCRSIGRRHMPLLVQPFNDLFEFATHWAKYACSKKWVWFPMNIYVCFCLQHLPSGKANSPTLNLETQGTNEALVQTFVREAFWRDWEIDAILHIMLAVSSLENRRHTTPAKSIVFLLVLYVIGNMQYSPSLFNGFA